MDGCILYSIVHRDKLETVHAYESKEIYISVEYE